jgi:hypothetical protein
MIAHAYVMDIATDKGSSQVESTSGDRDDTAAEAIGKGEVQRMGILIEQIQGTAPSALSKNTPFSL